MLYEKKKKNTACLQLSKLQHVYSCQKYSVSTVVKSTACLQLSKVQHIYSCQNYSMSTVVKYLFVVKKIPGKIKWSQVNLLMTEVDFFVCFFLTVHRSIELFHLPTLIHNSFIH
jgi:hypothetical protein